MITDYHTHVLPGIDDGACNKDMSLKMLQLLKIQGVNQVIATPHFYAHRESSVECFLKKRQQALEQIEEISPLPVLTGAEIYIEHGISEMQGLEKLAIQGTNLILLELPYMKYEKWISEEIYNISAEYGLKVILAHIHRYIEYYSNEQMKQILYTDAVFQINNEAFESLSKRSFVKSLIKQNKPVVFGSDCHNVTERKPNWKLVKRKCNPDILENASRILKKYEK